MPAKIPISDKFTNGAKIFWPSGGKNLADLSAGGYAPKKLSPYDAIRSCGGAIGG